ncbi:hypothetical protein DACRYDRAFT_88863 [Dacryopinax primogenitus]|uniref:Uncharacterized protein n=1 Tax=Dacryopinax primogenitus (strain DJM 731) TaxID=1858805 RepID=M5FVC8_DACPD|nr:uncharacterized protein DACRYDRAFT_88863 [Dacryopinax primogenitus]EJU01746.1 hypothetical protein DACRYDRAFT_88863 [Dacryopinax primogenitus]
MANPRHGNTVHEVTLLQQEYYALDLRFWRFEMSAIEWDPGTLASAQCMDEGNPMVRLFQVSGCQNC